MFSINRYFDEKVVSIAFQGQQLPATVGVISAGEYTFDTSKKETMTIVSGQLDVQLPHQQNWQIFKQNQSFDVPANVAFKVKTDNDCAYLCTYG